MLAYVTINLIHVKFLVTEEKFLKELLYIHNMIQKVPPSHKNPDPKAMNFTILVKTSAALSVPSV